MPERHASWLLGLAAAAGLAVAGEPALSAQTGAPVEISSFSGAYLAARVAEKVRYLGLHNPRAQSGRYLSVGSLIADAGTSEEAEALIARLKTEFAATRGAAREQRA